MCRNTTPAKTPRTITDMVVSRRSATSGDEGTHLHGHPRMRSYVEIGAVYILYKWAPRELEKTYKQEHLNTRLSARCANTTWGLGVKIELYVLFGESAFGSATEWIRRQSQESKVVGSNITGGLAYTIPSRQHVSECPVMLVIARREMARATSSTTTTTVIYCILLTTNVYHLHIGRLLLL